MVLGVTSSLNMVLLGQTAAYLWNVQLGPTRFTKSIGHMPRWSGGWWTYLA